MVWEARAKAESQLIASRAAKNKTKLPSRVDDNEWCDTQDDEELPPSPPDEVHIGSPHQDEDCPSLQETLVVSNVEMLSARDPHTLELDIQKLSQHVNKIM